MKIIDVKSFLFVLELARAGSFSKSRQMKASTVGEAYMQADRDRSTEFTVQQLRRYLIGGSPFDINNGWC